MAKIPGFSGRADPFSLGLSSSLGIQASVLPPRTCLVGLRPVAIPVGAPSQPTFPVDFVRPRALNPRKLLSHSPDEGRDTRDLPVPRVQASRGIRCSPSRWPSDAGIVSLRCGQPRAHPASGFFLRPLSGIGVGRPPVRPNWHLLSVVTGSRRLGGNRVVKERGTHSLLGNGFRLREWPKTR